MQINEKQIDEVLEKIKKEYIKARTKHPPLHSSHEGYAVLLEELEEWWESVKCDKPDDQELIQVAAMALSAILELKGDTVNRNYYVR